MVGSARRDAQQAHVKIKFMTPKKLLKKRVFRHFFSTFLIFLFSPKALEKIMAPKAPTTVYSISTTPSYLPLKNLFLLYPSTNPPAILLDPMSPGRTHFPPSPPPSEHKEVIRAYTHIRKLRNSARQIKISQLHYLTASMRAAGSLHSPSLSRSLPRAYN